MRRKLIRYSCMSFFLFAFIFLLTGCQTTGPDAGPKGNALAVGVTPNYPPLIFVQNQNIAGVEADLASELGKALGRPVRLIAVPWEDQIDALIQGRTDLIMSGMSVTAARKVRIAFSDPYLQLGIMALVRSRDANRYAMMENILGGDARIGVEKGSTADAFANRNCRTPNAIYYLPPADAPFFLTNRRIDVYLHDGPAVIWIASKNEADLEAVRKPLTKDEIAWGLRKDDDELRSSVNRILAQWKKDGTLQRILDKWLPPDHDK